MTSANKEGVCIRTIKYLQAVLTGKWIVSFDCKYNYPIFRYLLLFLVVQRGRSRGVAAPGTALWGVKWCYISTGYYTLLWYERLSPLERGTINLAPVCWNPSFYATGCASYHMLTILMKAILSNLQVFWPVNCSLDRRLFNLWHAGILSSE